MSVFGDFQQVWSQRFPHSSLPAAWEEDVRANLAKHKHKVSLLKEELEKEEFYVEYLERLLHDVEEHKKKIEQEKVEGEDVVVKSDVIADNSPKVDNHIPTAPPLEAGVGFDSCTVNQCVSELSARLCETDINNGESNTQLESDAATPQDPSSFVTVIEVNGLKSGDHSSPLKLPPKPPAKPVQRSNSSTQGSSTKASSNESLISSSEQLGVDEPFYDSVAVDDQSIKTDHRLSEISDITEPQSPGTASNYVNIEYFIKKRSGPDGHSSSDEDEVPEMRRSTDEGSYASSSSLESTTPSARRKFSQDGDSKSEVERMYRCMLSNIIDSEANYVEWLNVMLQYMKAIKATLGTSHPVITEAEFRTIFYKIPELHLLHSNFLEGLRRHSQKWDNKIGESFKNMALNLTVYGAFLGNYGRAIDTVRKCSASNLQFGEITKNIICKTLSGGPSISLEDLLHKPVARVQKNALVLHDLLKYTSTSHPDYSSLSEALQLTQVFLDQFNMIQTKSMFPASDRAQRRLVKNSFIVELVDNHRKLRHLFLFNDVAACAKYKSSGRNEKYTFELKWFIPVEDIYILEESTANPHEVSSSNIVSLKSQASNVRDQLRHEEKNEDKKLRLGRGSEKYRKRLLELESQLVLVSPNLVFRIKHRQTQKTFIFFLSSEFERTQWIEAIHTLQATSSPPTPTMNFSMFELQTWITACRTFLKTNMGSYLLRSGHDESLLVGDLHVTVRELMGMEYNADLYVCIEVDFYGHFFRKAKTKMVCNSSSPVWNESFVIDLEGCENLRFLVYRETGSHATLFGKHTQKLSRQWLGQNQIEKMLQVNGCSLRVALKFVPCEVSLRRVPTGKAGSLFGEKIQNVCKRQKRDIPFIVSACIREVERRGMSEVGIYRVSGSASDLARLKKTFESNSYEAEQLLKEVDIHSVTGILKLYLRELPEALYTDQLYPTLLEAFNQSNGNLIRRMELLKECFSKLPQQNKATIQFILDHLIRINQHENENKMSLHNLATVFGPTLLRPGGKSDNIKQRDLLATGTVDVMAQAVSNNDINSKDINYVKENLQSIGYSVNQTNVELSDDGLVREIERSVKFSDAVLLVTGSTNSSIIWKAISEVFHQNVTHCKRLEQPRLPPVTYLQGLFVLDLDCIRLTFINIVLPVLENLNAKLVLSRVASYNGDKSVDELRMVPRNDKVSVTFDKSPSSIDVKLTSMTLPALLEYETMLVKNVGGMHFDIGCDISELVYNQHDLHIRQAVECIEQCFKRYSPENVFVSFNGGKDCTVLLHLILGVLKKNYPNFNRRLFCLYVENVNPFAELNKFVDECRQYYNLDIFKINKSIKESLGLVLKTKPNMKGVLMGTRRTDPFSNHLESFHMTDKDWPQVMRVSPLLDWHYSQIWDYLLHLKVPYCGLYDDGYTSLGSATNTLPNPYLAVDNDTNSYYLPAYKLLDASKERSGRKA
ncbi:hypothetical protein FQR65_LT03501 [Abscondita terminalis]|nr:hypothetical protein FQR65_LT03501 [Abscondita terminalis]